ncbi:MAG: PadR family transcriptional regulator [Caulobacter sp.]
MKRLRKPSPQAVSLFAALVVSPSEWRHGYDLSRETGLSSGTLYPLLARWKSAGFLDAEWRASVEAGRPPRQVYRLTAEGLAAARAATRARLPTTTFKEVTA